MPKITAIELENFQSIGKKTIIPIRDLTLMFGPNGAGKSAVFDALEMLKLVVSNDWGENCSKLKKLINKWSRNIDTKSPSNSIGVGIQIFMDEKWEEHSDGYDALIDLKRIAYASMSHNNDYAEEFLGKTFQFYVNFKRNTKSKDSRGHYWYLNELSIKIENTPVLMLYPESEDELASADSGNNSNSEIITAHLLKKNWISFDKIDKLKISDKTNIFIDKDMLFGQVNTDLGWRISSKRWFTKQDFLDLELEYEFSDLIQEVIDFFKILISVELHNLEHVKASRTVPSVNESISLLPGKPYHSAQKIQPGYRLEWSKLLDNIKYKINGDDLHWVSMAKAIAESESSNKSVDNIYWSDLSILQKINSFLSDELFIENGYQLTAEIMCIAEIEDIEDHSYYDSSYYPKLIRLYLNDNHQRNLEFEDVGSGIGYVLPALASLAQDGISLIQQPELHLHPALQSKLGDVIVKAVENKRHYHAFSIIETHSEHLLLRVMRLIKNASKRNGEVIDPITFDRVAILYFEPLASGETQVKRLRLSPEGQLIDRWPGGFFNERFIDLFDE